LHLDETNSSERAKSSDVLLPPLNTHINFLHYTQTYSDQDHLDLHLRYSTSSGAPDALPETYDWRFAYPGDDSSRIEKKRYIMPPDNQYLCGSCWAISTASVIGDAFVVAGLVDYRPEISTTWALTCYPQGKCQGGSPALLLQDISRGPGIPSKHCLDYSFCAKNSKCNGSATRHFEAQNLSALLPKGCGCYYGGNETMHYNYTINRDTKTLAVGHGATTAENLRESVKKHILLHGPVLTGYFVMKNFSSGYFTKVNGGVYLDRCKYVPGEPLTFSDFETSGRNYKGSHAVAIVGWGVAKNILYDTDKRGDVPYWYCRNSWGPKWGDDDGYFKMAMHPFNKVAQFGTIVDIMDGQGHKHRCGGIITFTVSKPPQLKTFSSLKDLPAGLLRNVDYYKNNEKGNKPLWRPRPAQGTSAYYVEKIVMYVVAPALVLMILIVVAKYLKTP
jgi:hypothetical protein